MWWMGDATEMEEAKGERWITCRARFGMHVKAALCFATAGDGAGLCIDSGWESRVQEEKWRNEATHNIVYISTVIINLIILGIKWRICSKTFCKSLTKQDFYLIFCIWIPLNKIARSDVNLKKNHQRPQKGPYLTNKSTVTIGLKFQAVRYSYKKKVNESIFLH